MQFVPTANPVRNVPATIAGWARLSQVARDAIYAAWTDEVLIDVESSRLTTALFTESRFFHACFFRVMLWVRAAAGGLRCVMWPRGQGQ